MKEIEIRSLIDNEDDFKSFISKFNNLGFNYNKVERLSIVSGDYKLRDLETRLRISNKKITLAQKVGDVGAVTRDEIEFDLEIDKDAFFKLSIILSNLSKQTPDPYCVLMRHENHLFKNEKTEIKLFKQFAKGTFFGYEVEEQEVSEDELKEKSEAFGFKIAPDFDNDKNIRIRNSEINFPLNELSDTDLKKIISFYF